MVTYSDLFQFVIVLIALATLIIEICQKNNRPWPKSAVIYFN